MANLGIGGNGVVFKKFDPICRRVIAVKTLIEASPTFAERLRLEFNLLRDNPHPNLVNVFQFQGTPIPFYTMEFMSGGPITNVFDGGEYEWDVLLEVILQSLSGLQHLHSHDICHRDLKPHNILHRWNEDGTLSVKISDLGHSKQDVSSAGFSEQVSATIYGTPDYRPPESNVRSPRYRRRSDVFSWALSIAHVATGLRPNEYMTPPVRTTMKYSRDDLVAVRRGENVGVGLADDVADKLLECMCDVIDDRPSTQELLEFFNGKRYHHVPT